MGRSKRLYSQHKGKMYNLAEKIFKRRIQYNLLFYKDAVSPDSRAVFTSLLIDQSQQKDPNALSPASKNDTNSRVISTLAAEILTINK